MPNLFYRALSGPAGNQVSLLNAQGQLPVGAQATALDPSDIVYPAPGGGLLRVAVGGGAAAPMNGSANGQLTYWSQTGGLWLPTPTAPNDGDTAVWNAAANAWQYTPLPSLGALRYFDNTFSPVGLWNFNNTLNDANGVAANNFTTAAGTLGFTDIAPGKSALYVFVGNRFSTAAPAPAMLLQGDMSMFVVIQPDSGPATADQSVAFYGASTDVEATNIQWSMAFLQQTSPVTAPKRLNYLSEHGLGVNDSVDSGGNVSLSPVHNISLMGFTRIANVIQFYVNGLPFGPPSAAIVAPTGGTDPTMRLLIGAGSPVTVATASFVVFSMQVIASGLSAAQVKQLYNQSLGPAFGILT